MNAWHGTGRLTKAPDMRKGDTTVARFTVACDRAFKREGQDSADFISCVAFGKTAEFIERYFAKGMKIEVNGRIQTGSYTDKEGVKHYTTDVICESVAFGESKRAAGREEKEERPDEGFVNVAEGVNTELPFA